MHATEFFDSLEDEADPQLRDNGDLRHLLTLKGLDKGLLLMPLEHVCGRMD